MRQMFLQLKNGFARTKLAVCALGVLAWLVLVRFSGGTVYGAGLTALCAVLYMYLPGRFFGRLSGLEKALPGMENPLAILYGTGFFAALACVCIRLGLLGLLRVLPPVLGLVFLLGMVRLRPRGTLRALYADGGFLCRLALWGALAALFGLMVSVKNAHPAAAEAIVPNQDVLWNIGNAQSFALGFPPQDIRFSGVRLSYHYLTELVMGGLSLVSGVSCWDILTLYAGPLVLAALLCCVYALGVQFYKGSENKALAFTASLFLFNCASLGAALRSGTGIFSNTNLMHLITNVNSQSTALIFISIFAILLFGMAERGFAVSVRYVATFLCATVMVCFAKGPAAAIVLCSFCITMLFALARRPKYGRALVCLETVDSTNNEVKRRALAGAADGLAVVAEQQTGGRGRRGRSFVSPAGQGLYLSVLLRPRSPVRRCCVRRIPPRKQRNTPHSPPWAPAGVRAPQSRRWRSAKPGEPAAPVPRRRIR